MTFPGAAPAGQASCSPCFEAIFARFFVSGYKDRMCALMTQTDHAMQLANFHTKYWGLVL